MVQSEGQGGRVLAGSHDWVGDGLKGGESVVVKMTGGD